MHEFSICQTLVAAVLKELGKVKGEALAEPCDLSSEAIRAKGEAKNNIPACGKLTPSVNQRTTTFLRPPKRAPCSAIALREGESRRREPGLAKKGKQIRLKNVRVSAGQYRRIVPASLKFAYKILTKDTPAEGSSLLIKTVPIKLKCNECGWNGSTRDICFVCRKCGGVNMEIIGGKDLCLESIEVESAHG